MKRKPWLIIAAIGVAILVGLAVWVRPFSGETVYAGVNVEGVAVAGMSREEVRQMLTLWRQEYRNRNLAVYYGDTSFPISAGSFDYDIDVDATVDDVWNYGRRGSWLERLINIRSAMAEGYRVSLRVRYSEAKLNSLFEQWREFIDRPPRNAALSLLAGGIVPQEQGRKLELEALKPMVLAAMYKPEVSRLPLPVTTLLPEITVADINQTGLKEIMASYSTMFDASDINRSANIRLAARKINGYIVYPGQTFSFNQVVGPRDKEHGFKEAMEIIDGEFVPGIGGGVCQLSSTLYNAVLLSNLEITERYNHSKPLGYVELGRDATVAYNALDFQFTNTSGAPVMVMAETEKNKLSVGIAGQQPLRETVELLSVDRQVISPVVVKKPDQDLYVGETKVDRQGKPGYEITTIRVVSLGGKEIKREILGKDRYLPDNTVVKIGTRIPPFAQEKPSAGLKNRK